LLQQLANQYTQDDIVSLETIIAGSKLSWLGRVDRPTDRDNAIAFTFNGSLRRLAQTGSIVSE